jgi:hypothetical protein
MTLFSTANIEEGPVQVTSRGTPVSSTVLAPLKQSKVKVNFNATSSNLETDERKRKYMNMNIRQAHLMLNTLDRGFLTPTP